jgi:hypothetical protein
VERTPSAGRFTDDFLDELRQLGDLEADEVVAAYLQSAVLDVDGDGIDDLHQRPVRLMRGMLSLPVGSDRHPHRVQEFLHRPIELPSWTSTEQIAAGQDVFWTYAPQLGLGLWLASIPSGYAGARDAIVLGESIRCVSDPRSRFLETGQFVIDVMSPGALEPGGIGVRDIRHVRLVHALARHLIKEHQDLTDPDFTWTAELGEPVNQMALLATQFTFSVVGLEVLDKLGIRLTRDEAEAYVHLWNVVGALLGVREDLLPLDHAASSQVWARIKAREYAPSPQGVELTQAALGVMRQLMPGRLLDGFPATGIRAMIGDDVADLLEVPPANWTRSLLWPGRVANGLGARMNREIPVLRHLSKWMGRYVFTKFVEMELARQGERASFEIDDELRKRLVLRSRERRTKGV